MVRKVEWNVEDAQSGPNLDYKGYLPHRYYNKRQYVYKHHCHEVCIRQIVCIG